MRHILTLCIGNICRSPLAHGLLTDQLPGYMVWSAGLAAMVGQGADPLSIQVAAAHGLDISAHRAQQVNGFLCQQAELILVMETVHKTQLEQQFPSVRGKVFRLGHYQKADIADPYRQPLHIFQQTFDDIAQGVNSWVPRIKQLG